MSRKSLVHHITDLATSRKIHIATLVISILFVVATSIFVAYKSSVIHSYNHDNLIDSYMFNSYEDFKTASFPASHTFLLKWPFFALSGALGNSEGIFTALAIALYLATAMGIVGLIILICKKRILIGALSVTIYGLILLLIPAQSSPGVLAPVNMGMITTRNIEYLAYILFIFLIIRSRKIVSWSSMLAIITMTILGLSDKLFLLMALTAGVLNVAYQFIFLGSEGMGYLRKSLNPLVYIGAAYISVTGFALLIDSLHITHIYEPLSSAPFNFVSSVSQAQTAFEWAIQATMVNAGINPFGEAMGIKTLPYFINGAFFIVAIFASIQLYLKRPVIKAFAPNKSYILGYWLFLSTIAAFIIYTFSDHYLENDLRYMGIVTFTAIFSISIFLSKYVSRNLSDIYLLVFTLMLLCISPLFVLTARSSLNRDLNATKSIFEAQFESVSGAIKQYDVKVLIAEYPVTSPVRYQLKNTIQTSPLVSTPCIAKNYFLTSGDWYVSKNIKDRSALYIKDNKSDASNTCIDELHTNLGPPMAKVKISQHDTDELWIYNYDIRSKMKW